MRCNMQIQNDNFESYFKEEIQHASDLEIQSLRRGIEDIRKRAISDMKEEAQKEANIVLEQELHEVRSDYAIKTSKVTAYYNKMLMDKRDECTAVLFEDVQKELEAFAHSEQYVPFLLQKIEQVCAKLPYKVIIYIGKKDEQLIEKLQSKCYEGSKGVIDPTIQIGGFRLEYEDKGIIVDETFDFYLEKEKEWFYANSGFMIR